MLLTPEFRASMISRHIFLIESSIDLTIVVLGVCEF